MFMSPDSLLPSTFCRVETNETSWEKPAELMTAEELNATGP